MVPVKKLEIVTDSLDVARVIETLEAHGIRAYTVVRDVIGRGERGQQRGDDLSDVFKNSYLLTTCRPEKVDDVVAAVRLVLERRGGICLVTDALWVQH